MNNNAISEANQPNNPDTQVGSSNKKKADKKVREPRKDKADKVAGNMANNVAEMPQLKPEDI